MAGEIELLRALTTQLDEAESVDEMMQRLVDGGARLFQVPRCSAWLLDPTRTRLLVSARAGVPLHLQPNFEYRLGQGLLGWIAQHGQPIRTGAADEDPRFLARPGMVERMGSFLGVPLVSNRQTIGVFSAVNPEPSYFSEHHENLAVVLAAVASSRLAAARLERLAVLDEVTWTFNRRGLPLAYARAAHSLDHGRPVSVLLFDVDAYAEPFVRYERDGADELMRYVAERIRAALRAQDTLVRYAEHQFLAVLPGLDVSQATELAGRIRADVASGRVRAGEHEMSTTLSVAVTAHTPDRPWEASIVAADRALAESPGHDRIVVAL